jgi:hypothetical protein
LDARNGKLRLIGISRPSKAGPSERDLGEATLGATRPIDMKPRSHLENVKREAGVNFYPNKAEPELTSSPVVIIRAGRKTIAGSR